MRIGLDLDKLILPNLQLTKVYIKWNEKLFISIDEINVTVSNKSKTPEINRKKIKNVLFGIKLFRDWVEYVHIQNINIGDVHASFRYAKESKNYLKIDSDKFSLDSTLNFCDGYYNIQVNQARYFDKNVTVIGDIIFDLENLNSRINFDINLNSFTHFYLYGRASLDNLDFAIENPSTLSSVKEIVSLFGLSPLVTPWIDEYAIAKEINLTQATLHINLDDPDIDLLKSVFAHLRLKDVEYTFQEDGEPIKGKTVEIIFSEGKLYIIPVDATFYNYDIEKTWVYIDFNNKRIPLHIYINTYASLDQNLLSVLNYYDLDIPLIQHSGATHVDQYLKILLNKIELTAYGKYQLPKGEINYNGVDLNITDGEVTLKNTDLSLDHLIVNYQDWAQAEVNGTIDLKKFKGTINLTAQKILVGTQGEIQAEVVKNPLKIKYFLDKKSGDKVELSQSQWNYNNNKITLDPINTLFDLETLKAEVPTTFMKVNQNIDALLTGNVDFKKLFADLDVDLLQLNFEGIHTKQTNTPMKLIFDSNVKISSKELSRWSINGLDFLLNPTEVEITPTDLNILDSGFNFNDIVHSNVDGYYNFLNRDGKLTLSDTQVNHPKFGSLIDYEEKTDVNLENINSELHITIPSFHTKFKTKGEGWYADIKDISTFYKYSKILQDYNLSKGKIKLHSNDGKKPYKISSRITYPYALVVQNGEPIYEYYIKAEINEENVEVRLNNRVDINIAKDIVVESKNVGFNFHEIIRYLAEHDFSEEENSQRIEIYASNSYIYISEERKAIADAIILKIGSGLTHLELYHKLGYANLEYKDQSFYLYGQDFSDIYMNELFALAQMQHGSFSFAMSGNFSKFSGIARVDDTIIKDYLVLNNLLAFVNTIPSLASFKLPDYNGNGLKTIKAYTGFTYDEGNVSFNDISLDSKELDIKGKGYLNLNTDKLNVDLFLKTDLGSTLAKIPVVGYILLGDDGSISTSVNMSGTSEDPEITNALAKDIISAPFNILKRTITYPFQLFSSKKKKDDK